MYEEIQNIIIGVLWGVLCPSALAVSYGSYSAVARQAFVVFPASDANNTIVGYITFDSGFRLENSATNCTFNGVLPVSGPIELSGGTLQLSKSFICQAGTTIPSMGTIAGNNLALVFSTTSPFIVPSGGGSGNVPYFVSSGAMGSALYSCSWSSDGAYIASIAGTSFRVFSFDGSSLVQMASTTLSRTGYSVAWMPGGDYVVVARQRALELWYYDRNAKTLTNKQTISYGFSNAYAVTSSLDGHYVAVGTNVSGQQLITYFFDATAGTLTQAAVFSIPSAPIININALCWDSTGVYIAIGTAAYSGGPEVLVYSFDRTASSITLNASVELGQSATEVHFHPKLPLLAVPATVGSASFFLYAHDASAGTLTSISSGEIDDPQAFQTVDWNTAGTQLAVGKDAGNGALSIYDFDITTSSFTLSSQLNSSGSFYCVRWRYGGIYLGAGGTLNRQDIYGISSQKFSSGLIIGNCKVTFDSDVIFQSSITFTGMCCVEGSDNVITLSQNGSIVIDKGASVLFKDMTLVGITGTNVRCLDSLSTISFSNAVLGFSGYTTFTQGHFDIVGDTMYTGTQVFAYQSSVASTIGKNAALFFDSGMTFSYDPSTSSKTLLQMADNSACLHLNNTQLYASAVGLQLTIGRFIIEGNCPFISDGADVNHGISFGNGMSASNNLNMAVIAGSGILCTCGFLVNNNVL